MKEQLNFKLEVFEGPLDLMLSLISKHKLNIQDIEIAVLLEQFLKYIEEVGEYSDKDSSFEIAGEFLEMAARLIYIKSVSLLPKHEAEALKKELEGALIEYALCKATAERLRETYIGDIMFTRIPTNLDSLEVDLSYNLTHSAQELIEAIGTVSYRDKLKNEPPSPKDVNPTLEINYVSVFSKIIHVLKKIRHGTELEIKTLFKGQNRSEQIATFLALLELSSHGKITFSKKLDYIEFAGKPASPHSKKSGNI